MAKRSSLRASDDDRERVAQRLHQAATEGRILAHELEDRMATALRARTYGELDAVVADLPGASVGRRDRPRSSAALLPSEPVALVATLVAATIVIAVLAAVVVAGLFAFSGIWAALIVVMVVRRGGVHHRQRYAHRSARW